MAAEETDNNLAPTKGQTMYFCGDKKFPVEVDGKDDFGNIWICLHDKNGNKLPDTRTLVNPRMLHATPTSK